MNNKFINENDFINNFNFSKQLGQNFLIDNTIKERIIKTIRSFVLFDEFILEIGPGIGAITKKIINTNHVIAIELDEELVNYLNNLHLENFKVIYGDCLKLNLNDYLKNVKLIFSNTPYAITTQMIQKFIEEWNCNQALFLMQKEVATRICAKINDKKYAAFSIYCQTFLDMKNLFDVSNNAFFPKPKVTSSLIYLFKKNKEIELNKKAYWTFLNKCFLNRRKTLFNNLKQFCNKDIINLIFKYLHLDLTSTLRAQELNYEQFINIYKIYENNN
ncbi:MAG: ribosomal RNA small subunit methyltransferase A [Mycoplasmataceae bacterium]|nr:ribosomal RNA small subunit methyltransferase A [Mycoplasmataceae bacterium]